MLHVKCTKGVASLQYVLCMAWTRLLLTYYSVQFLLLSSQGMCIKLEDLYMKS